MQEHELLALIRAGVPAKVSVWAELGAGSGNFSFALRSLLPPQAQIYAIDRDKSALQRQQQRLNQVPEGAQLIIQQADFTQKLDLPPLDGVLMANALHFVRDQESLLERIHALLKPSGRLLLVEYDQSFPLPWVPYPIPANRFAELVQSAGFVAPRSLAMRRSPSRGDVMYSALAYASTSAFQA